MFPPPTRRCFTVTEPDEGAAWVGVVDDYLIDWLPYHLVGAGRGEECRDLLFDLAWLRRKLAARDVHALIADTAHCAGDAEVERLGRTLRMSAHVLSRDKRQLSAQLLGRLQARGREPNGAAPGYGTP